MPFSEFIGQDRAAGLIRAAIARGTVHHAWLLAGPEGVGKHLAARLLAQALNCEAPPAPGDACGACGPCRKIARGAHPDVLELAEERAMVKAGRWEPKGGRTPSRDVVVDQIRDLVDHRLALRRFEGRRRVVIIDPADAMNPSAQNALLKTLEEPPEDTVLVLVSGAPDALLPTVRSRCARVSFAPLPVDLVAARLAAAKVDPAVARVAAAQAGGSLGRALELAKALAREAKGGRAPAQPVADAARLDPADASTWIAYAAEHAGDRETARETCALLALWLRDLLAVQAAGEETRLALPEVREATAAAARALAPSAVVRRLRAAREAREAIDGNASAALAVERMLIGWFHGERA